MSFPMMLYDDHGVAEREETVFFFDCLFIGVEDVFPPGECGDEHDEGAFREVEIGDQAIDALKAVAGVNESICKAGVCAETSIFGGT